MLANTPPMGWNSWNTFGEHISEDLIKETADAMVSKGLLDAGYKYLVIDDCWSEKERDKDGNLVPDHVKFPHGIKAVSDYVHSKGLKFGMYSCCGLRTCADYPGSMNHEFQDAKFFEKNGVDFLKYDNCYHPDWSGKQSYNTMSLALRSCKREILFSMCNWGNEEVWKWARQTGAHMYRSTGDIFDSLASIDKLSKSQIPNLGYSGNGCFNDIDMLVCGMKGKGNVGIENGCTPEEYRYHFAVWSMFMSPLMLGCDVRNIDEDTLKLVTNKNLLRINQDPEARGPLFCHDIRGSKDSMITFRYLSNHEFAIGMFKPWKADDPAKYDTTHVSMFMSLAELGLPRHHGYGFELTDCFTGEKVGVFDDYIRADFDGRVGCKVYLAKLVKTK